MGHLLKGKGLFQIFNVYLINWVHLATVKPGLHVRRKQKNKHKHKHVYTCDKHTQAQKQNKFGAIARPGCLLARDLIPTWRKMATHE